MARKIGRYDILRTIGEGSLGKVKLAEDSVTHEKVAIKVFDKDKIKKQNMGEQIKKEISIMKMLNHPYIVNMKEALGSNNKIFIVLEYVANGELFEYIDKKKRLPENEARLLFRQIVSAVSYIHMNNICHRDIKPENLLMGDNGVIKLSDFGLAAIVGETNTVEGNSLLHTTCGSPNYVAPEVLMDNGYSGKISDVWSVGVLLYVMIAGYYPFDEPTLSSLFRRIQSGTYVCPPEFSEELKDLLSKILVVDPKNRIAINDIFRQPWFLGKDLSLEQSLLLNQLGSHPSSSPPMSLKSGSSGSLKKQVPLRPSQVVEQLQLESLTGEVEDTRDRLSSRSSNADEPKLIPIPMTIFDMLNVGFLRMFRNIAPPQAKADLIERTSFAILLTSTRPDQGYLILKKWLKSKEGKIALDLSVSTSVLSVAYVVESHMIRTRILICQMGKTTFGLSFYKVTTLGDKEVKHSDYLTMAKDLCRLIPDSVMVSLKDMEKNSENGMDHEFHA